MKKSIAITSALVFTLGVAGTAFAATNPFVDVPAKHWSYDAVSKLAKDGIVQGYDDKTFQGDKQITRYEMAIIVAKAMGKAEKANAEDKALLEKLSAEYTKELNAIGVRLDNVEKKVDKLSVSGAARIRGDHNKVDGQPADMDRHINLDVFYAYKINNDWSVKGESEWQRKFNAPKTDSSTVDAQFEQLYVNGPIGGANIKVGKYSYFSNYGLLYDDKLTGAAVSFGNKLKLGLNFGDSDATNAAGKNNNVSAIDAKWAATNNLNIVADWERVKNKPDSVNYYDIGFDTKLGQNFTLQAMYAKSNMDVKADNAHFAQLTYKAADASKVGSYDIFAAYRKIPGAAFAPLYPTGDWVRDFKGLRVGFDYVPMENAKFTTWYQSGKSTDDAAAGVDTKIKTYRAQVEFYF